MSIHTHRVFIALATILVAIFSTQASAEQRSLCLFDPVGERGDMYAMLKDFRVTVKDLGVDLELKPFDSESVIVNEFKAGKCDSIAVTGMKVRPFNQFTATIEAVGALPAYEDVHLLMKTMTNPGLQDKLVQGEYEVAGVLPVGNVYTFLKRKKWATQGLQDHLQGKKVSVFEGDNVSYEMVRNMGANPVVVTTTSFSGMFNNGAVDITFAPAVAYEPMELYKGLANNGGIIRTPLIQLTFQMVIRHKRFPEGFGQKLREISYRYMGFALQYVHMVEKKIPERHWVELPMREVAGLTSIMRQTRMRLRDRDIYDGDMLNMMRKIRCQRDPSHFECIQKLE
ncbi:RND type efflux pump involved in aminoglycoside resistance [gamma proteobacterium HTCC5015]|nr:RND type efflux pump involved in aminoglycoside resistance [gamma proteobacterium HTCC5015]